MMKKCLLFDLKDFANIEKKRKMFVDSIIRNRRFFHHYYIYYQKGNFIYTDKKDLTDKDIISLYGAFFHNVYDKLILEEQLEEREVKKAIYCLLESNLESTYKNIMAYYRSGEEGFDEWFNER